MTNIVVLVKQVPDTYSERKLNENDHTLDRESADAVIDEINERAVEEALKIKEAGEGEVTVLCVGPDRATDAGMDAPMMGSPKSRSTSSFSVVVRLSAGVPVRPMTWALGRSPMISSSMRPHTWSRW